MRMCKVKLALAGVAVLLMPFARAAQQSFTPAKSGVEKPSLKPAWSGAKAGVWTMDYQTALQKAAVEGKYTVMYFAGLWWCPRCKEFDRYVLDTSAWKKFVKDRGLYLTVLDHPKRDGRSGWCWLWEPSYRKSAKLDEVGAMERILEQYDIQDAYHDPLPGHFGNKTAENVLVTISGKGKNVVTNYEPYAEEPVSQYRSLNYPAVLIFAPDGTVAGRFVPDTAEKEVNEGYTLETALQFTMDHIDAAINPGAVNAWKGNWTLAYSKDGVNGIGSLSVTVDAKGKVKLVGFTPEGKKISVQAPFVTGVEKCTIPIRLNKKDELPAFTVCIRNDTNEVTLEGEGVKLVRWGAAQASLPEYVTCTITGFPSEIGGYEVDPESVPSKIDFTVKGGKMTSAGGIKFTYVQKTGTFKGTFKVNVLKKGKPAKVSVSVNGVCADVAGFGQALPKGGATAAVMLAPTEEEECGECGL